MFFKSNIPFVVLETFNLKRHPFLYWDVKSRFCYTEQLKFLYKKIELITTLNLISLELLNRFKSKNSHKIEIL